MRRGIKRICKRIQVARGREILTFDNAEKAQSQLRMLKKRTLFIIIINSEWYDKRGKLGNYPDNFKSTDIYGNLEELGEHRVPSNYTMWEIMYIWTIIYVVIKYSIYFPHISQN